MLRASLSLRSKSVDLEVVDPYEVPLSISFDRWLVLMALRLVCCCVCAFVQLPDTPVTEQTVAVARGGGKGTERAKQVQPRRVCRGASSLWLVLPGRHEDEGRTACAHFGSSGPFCYLHQPLLLTSGPHRLGCRCRPRWWPNSASRCSCSSSRLSSPTSRHVILFHWLHRNRLSPCSFHDRSSPRWRSRCESGLWSFRACVRRCAHSASASMLQGSAVPGVLPQVPLHLHLCTKLPAWLSPLGLSFNVRFWWSGERGLYAVQLRVLSGHRLVLRCM